MTNGNRTDTPSHQDVAPAKRAPRVPFYAKPAIQLLFITVVGLIAYSNTFHAPFVLDDELSIASNPIIKDLAKFLSGEGYAYNPRRFVGYLTVAINYRLGGLDLTGYHMFNLAVHILSACMVYALVRLTLRTPFFREQEVVSREPGIGTATHPNLRSLVPVFAALLFVAHPVQTQAVTYIIQRLASLATMFYLLSVVLYIKARLGTEPLLCTEASHVSETRTPTTKSSFRLLIPLSCYFGALVAAGLAMKTKEIAFTLPFVVMLYEFTFFRMTLLKKLLFLLPVALTALIVPISLVGTGKSLGQLISDVAEKTRVETAIPRLDYLYTQFRVIVTYLRLLIFPAHQNLDYDYPVYHSFFTAPVLLSFVLLTALAALAVYLYYRSSLAVEPSAKESSPDTHSLRLIGFGIFWFFITLSVESSFIPIADVIFEHRLYLPSVGAFVALAALAALSLRQVPVRRAVIGAGIAIALLTAATFARNLVWSDSVALARDVVQKSPDKARTHYNLATALQSEGRFREAFDEAVISSRLDPSGAKPHHIMGMIYSGLGRYDKAIAELGEAIRLDPGFAKAHGNLGSALSAAGQKEQALAQHFLALKLKPANAETYNKIGMIYGETGRMDEAVAFFQSATCLDPANSAFASNLQRAQQLSQQAH